MKGVLTLESSRHKNLIDLWSAAGLEAGNPVILIWHCLGAKFKWTALPRRPPNSPKQRKPLFDPTAFLSCFCNCADLYRCLHQTSFPRLMGMHCRHAGKARAPLPFSEGPTSLFCRFYIAYGDASPVLFVPLWCPFWDSQPVLLHALAFGWEGSELNVVAWVRLCILNQCVWFFPPSFHNCTICVLYAAAVVFGGGREPEKGRALIPVSWKSQDRFTKAGTWGDQRDCTASCLEGHVF